MKVILGIADTLVFLYILVLFGRVVIDLVQVLARDWRPKGFWLVLCMGIYTITDPPLRALRRLIPPLTLGQVRLDLAFLVLLIGCSVLRFLIAGMAAAL